MGKPKGHKPLGQPRQGGITSLK